MIVNGKNVCDICRSCFTCGTPRKTLVVGTTKKDLCPRCYDKEVKK